MVYGPSTHARTHTHTHTHTYIHTYARTHARTETHTTHTHTHTQTHTNTYTRTHTHTHTHTRFFGCFFFLLTLLTRCTGGQHEVPTTVYHFAFGDNFVQRYAQSVSHGMYLGHILVQTVVQIMPNLNQVGKPKPKHNATLYPSSLTSQCTYDLPSYQPPPSVSPNTLSLSHSTTASTVTPPSRPHASYSLLNTTTHTEL